MDIRVRIAPSPTGYFHVGTARTALFNYLFTKKHGGQFILRIEDTDQERSDARYEQDILDGLRWLELAWDEGPVAAAADGGLLANQYHGDYGPYRQSERGEWYDRYLNQLLEQGRAYHCYCSKDELETERQAQLSQGLPPKYSGRCLYHPPAGREPQLVRFKVPESRLIVKDTIRGEIEFKTGILGDIAIARHRPQGFLPLYNFAVVVDDHEMRISHVIRGEEHLPNTPKQLLLIEALGFSRPHYAHLPLIVDRERAKLSKRSSATAIADYRQDGYLPEAIVNFLALLGWHPAAGQPVDGTADDSGRNASERELFSLEELVQSFDLSRVQKSAAAFNIEKLNWFNGQYLKHLSTSELGERLNVEASDKNLKIVAIVKERMVKLSDFDRLAGFFFRLPDYRPELLLWQGQARTQAAANLEEIIKIIDDSAAIMALAEARGRGAVLWPLRVALSGLEASPGPLEILEVIGLEEARRRMAIAVEKLNQLS